MELELTIQPAASSSCNNQQSEGKPCQVVITMKFGKHMIEMTCPLLTPLCLDMDDLTMSKSAVQKSGSRRL